MVVMTSLLVCVRCGLRVLFGSRAVGEPRGVMARSRWDEVVWVRCITGMEELKVGEAAELVWGNRGVACMSSTATLIDKPRSRCLRWQAVSTGA